METLDVIEDGVARSNGLIACSFYITDGEFIKRVPVDLPEDCSHYDYSECECYVAYKLS